MNEEETTVAKKTEHPESGMVDRPVEVARPPEADGRPATCTLYRWYPPLLVLSTVMAGVFCVLYVTKPVFLEAPNPEQADQLNVRVYAEQIADTGQTDNPPSTQPGGVSIMPAQLDPGLSSVPRRAERSATAGQGIPDVSELRRMPVPRSSKPLFQPLKPEEMPPPKAVAIEVPEKEDEPTAGDEPRAMAAAEPVEEAPKAAVGEQSEEAIAVATQEELEAGTGEFPGAANGEDDDPLVADVEEPGDTGKTVPEGPTMRASLLGEFYVVDSKEQDSSTRNTGSSTAMANQMD